MTDPSPAPTQIIFRYKRPTKRAANNEKKSCFLKFPSFLIVLPPSLCKGSDTNIAAFLLTKLLILVLSVENNKTLNPGRAGEPYVPCSLSFERAALPPSYQRRFRFGGSCLLPDLWGSCVIMDGDYRVLVGRRRPQLIISETKSAACCRVACWIPASTAIILQICKNSLHKMVKRGAPGSPQIKELPATKRCSFIQTIWVFMLKRIFDLKVKGEGECCAEAACRNPLEDPSE